LTAHTALIIDDDTESATHAADCLRDVGRALVDPVAGSDVVEAVKQDGVNICIVGHRAMSRDGYEIVRDLRERSPAGIVMLNDSSKEIDVVLALEMGADDYMVKPVRPREFCARIRTILRRTVVTPPSADGARPVPDGFLRRVDDLEICGVLRLVSVAGREVSLTDSEFDVLMVLAAQTNRVLSREQIIASVKGEGHAITDRLVDGIISRLRRKLFVGETGFKRIRTVHGRGYMIVEGV